MKSKTLRIMFAAVGLQVAQAQVAVITSGECSPGGTSSCFVEYTDWEGAIGCYCYGNCTNSFNPWVNVPSSWACEFPQYGLATGGFDGGQPPTRVWAQGEVTGPGSPGYESYKEWNYCNGVRQYEGEISGVC
jgi:hypothetical protein